MQRRILKDLLTYLPGSVLPALAAFVTVPIYTRLFSPSEYGNYALALAAEEFLVLGIVTGFGQASVRFFSAYKLKSDLSSYFSTIFGSVGLITLIGLLISALVLVVFKSFIPSDLYLLLWDAVALFVVTVCYSTLMDVLRGQEKSRWYTSFTLFASLGGILFGLLFVLKFNMGIGGLIWGQTFGLLVPIVPLIWLTTHSVNLNLNKLNRSTFNQLWAFALPYTIGNLAFWSLNLSDRYIVEIYRGSYEVGLYSIANKISGRTILILVNLFFLVPAPIVSRLWEERGRRATEDALTDFTRIFCLLLIPAVAGIAVISTPLVHFLTDPSYYGSQPAIWLLACGSMALGLSDLGSVGCIVTNRTTLIARNQVIAAIFNLILTVFLVRAYGFMGAAWATFLSFALLAILQPMSSAHFFTWRWPIRTLWHVLVATAMMCASVFLVQIWLPSTTAAWHLANLMISIIIAVLVYSLALWILGELTPSGLLSLLKRKQYSVEVNPIPEEIGHSEDAAFK